MQTKLTLAIPKQLRTEWEKCEDANGDRPAARSGRNYQYGVKRAAIQCGLHKQSLALVYRWVQNHVVGWMQDLRETGLGRVRDQLDATVDTKLVQLFKKWRDQYKEVSCVCLENTSTHILMLHYASQMTGCPNWSTAPSACVTHRACTLKSQEVRRCSRSSEKGRPCTRSTAEVHSKKSSRSTAANRNSSTPSSCSTSCTPSSTKGKQTSRKRL